jgi:hypothetical protein
LAVEQEESRQFGSWLYRRDSFVADDDFGEKQPSEAVALLWQRRCPGRRHIRQQRSQAGKASCLTLNLGIQKRELALEARAHARAGDPVQIAAYLGTKDAFDRAVAHFAQAYADQVEHDDRAFLSAIASSRIVAESTDSSSAPSANRGRFHMP